ncbi:MAG: MOSC domain-containing protein [Gemmatimonadota bacterium]|nr:MOSC domain-containing protein [Gemmatimonadota bacterium]MDH4350350.1 MOSC domain-containing protein [Gemmatimonadota bacterium]MDH5195663.1 MOSC domain-containing protein [Gemmatimonadota bacterium]
MRLISVNVSLPRLVQWKGETVETGIFKEPRDGPVGVALSNLEGDRQADLTVHGGVDKAVYAYPAEHYPFWSRELSRTDLTWGMFGENLTTEGLDEATVRVGDRFLVGTAELEVSQPRLPCYKLGIKFGRADMVKRFLQSRRLGFYLRVLGEGTLAANDPIRRLGGDQGSVSIADLALLETTQREDVALLERAVRAAALTESWRLKYREHLARLRS